MVIMFMYYARDIDTKELAVRVSYTSSLDAELTN